VKKFIIDNLSAAPLHIIVKVHGFKQKIVKGGHSSSSDDGSSDGSESASPVKFTGRFNTAKVVQTRTVISKSAVKNKVTINAEVGEVNEDKGEVFYMEGRLNSKYFHKIASIKLTSREDTPEWYGIIVSHGEMCGVFIPHGTAFPRVSSWYTTGVRNSPEKPYTVDIASLIPTCTSCY
jgi:hypothetical protein